MIVRSLIVTVLLLGAAAFGTRASGSETPVVRDPLASLEYSLEEWQGREATPLNGDVVAQLGVDDYINRAYSGPSGVAIGLYAGYYTSQRQGDTIHSPQNCLPGAGWQPVSANTVALPLGGRQVTVNQYVIQKGLDQQVVLYWYQGRGRIVANEFANKALLMWDAATMRRTNGGLVRVISPLSPNHDGTSEAKRFATALVPKLERLMP
jgi:EpsI family protein